MELNELFDKLRNEFDGLNNIIKSQRVKIDELNREGAGLRAELSAEKARYNELEGKWNRMQKLVRGEGNE